MISKNEYQRIKRKVRGFKILILWLSVLLFFQNSDTLCQFEQTGETILQMEKLLADISGYEYDKSREWLPEFQAVMQKVYQDFFAMKETERMMLKFLKSDATLAGKQFICKHLSTIATKESVSVMNKMLTEANTAEMALGVLQKIPDPAAGKIMIHALSKSEPKIKVAIIHSLGACRNEKSVKALAKLVYDKDPMISESAISALGAIGSEEAAVKLNSASDVLHGDLRWQVMNALLKCADRFISENKYESAQKIYTKVYDTHPPDFLQIAALKGMFYTTDEDPVIFIISHLQNDDPEIIPAVISFIYELPEQSNPSRIYGQISNLSEMNRLYLFTAVAYHGDPSFNKTITDAINDDNAEMRIAGLKAIARSGTSSDVLFLAEKASILKGNEKNLTRESLYTMHGEDVDKAILNAIETDDPKIKVELIRCIGERNISSATDILLNLAGYPDPAVRAESIEALGKIAVPEDLPGLIQILINSSSERERRILETAICLVTLKMMDGERKSKDILDVMPSVKDPTLLNSFIAILGEIGDNLDYPVLKEFLYSAPPEIQLAALRALSDWPDATPKNDLKTITETTADARKHTLALRGYVQVVVADGTLSQDQKYSEIHHAFNMASGIDEQKIVLSGLGKINSYEALKFSISLMNNKDLIRETEAAILNIAENLSWSYPVETRDALNEVLQITDNEEFKTEIKNLLKNIRK
jgi:HEAT repeat protein